ncbi:hypothetical protein pipiens_004961, partial [Culex pipiens pipiens]
MSTLVSKCHCTGTRGENPTHVLPSALDISSGTATNSIYPNFYPSDVIEDPPPTSTYPYFLFPSKKYPPSAFQPALYSGADYINVPAGNTNQSLPHHHRSSYHPSSPADPLRAMGMDDNYHRLLDQNMALIETPLVAPAHAYFPQHYKTALYPYNISGYHHQHQHGLHGGHFGHNGNGNGNGHGHLAPASMSSPVDNILINLSGDGNGDAAIEYGSSSFDENNAVERQ